MVAAGLLGVGVAAGVLLVATKGFAWISTQPQQIAETDLRGGIAGGLRLPARSMRLASVIDDVGAIDRLPGSGALTIDSAWIVGPELAAGPRGFVLASLEASADSERDARVARIIIETVPVPSRNPMSAGRLPDVPLPRGNPLPRESRLAALTPGDLPAVPPPPARAPETPPAPAASAPTPAPSVDAAGVPLPTAGSGYALYDIEGQVVYMPNGERLEAHSGYGDAMDNMNKVALRMRGPTPPNVYNLRPREALFHGVETLRLTPVGDGKMYGRDGFLVHPFMMGPRGDSNGCVSVKDHEKFLAAYRRGEVRKLVVVARLPNSSKPAPSLLSWLLPKPSTLASKE